MKRIVSLLLTLAMLFALAACSSTPTESIPADSTATTTNLADEPADATTAALPLTTETVTFTSWLTGSFPVSDDQNMALQDTPAYQWIEETTGIHMEIEVASSSAASEQFNLMLVSESYPDFIYYNLSNYVGGMAKYIEDDIIVDIAPYLEQYAPNYSAIRNEDDSVRKATTLDNGMVGGFFRVLTHLQHTWMGPMLRADWLEEMALEAPKTVEEWTNVLTAFRDREDCAIPYVFSTDGNDNALRTAYDLPDDKFFPVDGQIQYRYATDNFRDYLVQANAWYAAGLISKDFYGESYAWNPGELSAGDKGGMVTGSSMIDTISMLNPEVQFIGVQAPTLTEGGSRIASITASCNERVEAVLAAITTNCKNVELLVQFLDFFYSEEGSRFGNFGIENESYTISEVGDPLYTDLVKNSGQNISNTMAYYGCYNSLPFHYNPDAQYQLASEPVKACGETWDSNLDKEHEIIMPAMVSLTAEEAEIYSSIVSNTDTMAAENIIRFIIGDKPLSEFDAFVSELYALGLQEAIDAQQAAYERYLAR